MLLSCRLLVLATAAIACAGSSSSSANLASEVEGSDHAEALPFRHRQLGRTARSAAGDVELGKLRGMPSAVRAMLETMDESKSSRAVGGRRKSVRRLSNKGATLHDDGRVAYVELRFDVDDVVTTTTLTAAVVYVATPAARYDCRIYDVRDWRDVTAARVRDRTSTDDDGGFGRLVTAVSVDASPFAVRGRAGRALDVTSLLTSSRRSRKRRMLLVVARRSRSGNFPPCAVAEKPLLLLLYESADVAETPHLPRSDDRIRRSADEEEDGICGRRSMVVALAKLGWGRWAIAPRQFQAYRCAGSCPYPLAGQLNGTNYSVLKSMMTSALADATDDDQPCCVPTQLGAMSLLYLDGEDNVVLRHYDDMIVHGCGCR